MLCGIVSQRIESVQISASSNVQIRIPFKFSCKVYLVGTDIYTGVPAKLSIDVKEQKYRQLVKS
jgi:hypothetical protein